MQALQSRQASAECSTAAASREPSAAQEPAPPGSAAAEAAPAAALDDEALLLSGLLNSAAATERASQGLQNRLVPRPRPAVAVPVGDASRSSSVGDGTSEYSAEFSELPPAASSNAVSLASHGSKDVPGSGVAEEQEPTQLLRSAGEDEPSADCVAAAAVAEHSAQRGHSFQDAADDTVLTGSPQANAAGSSGAGSPLAGSPTAEQQPTCTAAGVQPGMQALGTAAAQQAAANSCAVPAQQTGVHPRPSTALPSRLPKPPPKAPIPQQQWTFAAIPQGTASIPSRVPAPERRPAAAAGGGSKPAFFTRAASPPPRPLAALPAAGGAGLKSRTAGEAQESRRQRLERLAQPKRSVPSVRRQPAAAAPAAASRAFRLGIKPATAPGSKRVSAATECGVIAAWRPGEAEQVTAGTAEAPAEAAPVMASAPPAAIRRSLPQQAASSSRTDRRWPAALGRPLDGVELQRATGAYSEERFQAHLARLQQALAPHRQRRQHEAEAASAGELGLLQGGIYMTPKVCTACVRWVTSPHVGTGCDQPLTFEAHLLCRCG